MADPLTVFGAVASTVQIIDVLTKATSVLDTLRAQWQSSDIALLSLTSQLGALSTALVKIQEWMENGIEEIHHQLTIDLSTALNCCNMLATKVYGEISDLQKAPGGSLLTTAKARFLFKRSGIGELQSMIDRQVATLTLLLTACNSKSLSRQQEILGASGVRRRMSRVQKDTESLSGTLDSSSFLSRSTAKSSRLSLLFDFDEQLFSSKPYTAMIRKTVKMSIRSPMNAAPGPEEVITSIASDAAGSKGPASRPPRENGWQYLQYARKPTKIVLLGQGESSKSTILKQMQWIYDSGFSTNERNEWRTIIHDNTLATLEALIKVLDEGAQNYLRSGSLPAPTYDLHSARDMQERLQSFSSVLRTDDLVDELFAIDFALGVEQLLRMPVPEVRYICSSNSLDYFARHIGRIFNPAYVPTFEDIARARVRTTGIYKHRFDISDYGPCDVYDVGGERSERKKWSSIFDQSSTFLVCVPIDCYDQVLFEDDTVNRILEALTLFESLESSTEWFSHNRLVLCFTKYDLFEQKIESGLAPLTTIFPDYKGSPTDVIASRNHVTEKFTSRLQQRDKLGVFYINATDTEHVREVVQTVLGQGHPMSARYRIWEKRTDSLDLDELDLHPHHASAALPLIAPFNPAPQRLV